MIAIDNTFVRMFSSVEQLIMIRLLLEADDDGKTPLNEGLLSVNTNIAQMKICVSIQKLIHDGILTKEGDSVVITDYAKYKFIPKRKAARKKAEVVVSSKSLNDRMHDFGMSLTPYIDTNGGKYPKEMIRAFYDYWSEPNQSQTKMRWELQKTWSVAGRLATWASKDRNFIKRNRDEQRAIEVQRRKEGAANILARLAAEEQCDNG